MKEFIVKTQKDFDAIKDQKQLTKIRIESLPSERLVIDSVPKNCFIECWASSQPTIECGDSSQPTIRCWASSQPTIECGDSSQPTIRCWDSSQPTIRCWASSQPTIECGASSQPTIRCGASSQPTIECWASSQPTIECGDSSQPTIRCWDSSQPTIRCWDSSQPTIECGASSQPTIECWQQSTLVMRGDKKQVTSHQQSLVRYILEEKPEFASVEAWLKYWELTPKDGKVTLFKAVKPDSYDFRTGTVLYADDAIVECPDWLENFAEECGHGLHCSPHLFLTEKYAQLPHIHKMMEVDVADIRLPKGFMEMSDKVRVKRVQNVQTVNERGKIVEAVQKV